MNRRLIAVIGAGLMLAATLLFPLTWPARAAESRTGETIVIAAGEVVDDDLYVTANRFVLDGTVTGDVIAFGSMIEINGTISGDLLAAGQSIVVNGAVEDDARIAGAALTIGEGARLGDDLVGAAASLEARTGSTIAGDLLYAGAQALLAGEVAGDAMIGTGSLALQGTIGGNVTASVDAAGDAPDVSPFAFIPNMPQVPVVPPGLTFGPTSRIGGALTYTSPSQATIPEGIVAAGTSYRAPVPADTEPERPQTPPAVQRLLEAVRRLTALILVGLLALWLFPHAIARATDILRSRPIPSLGWGLLGWIAGIFGLLLILLATIVLAILLGILTLGRLVGTTLAVGGVSLGAGATTFSLLINYGSVIIASLWLGQFLLGRIRPAWSVGRVAPMLLGMVLIAAVSAVPVLGTVVDVAVILLGFGAIALGAWEAIRPRLQAAPAPASP